MIFHLFVIAMALTLTFCQEEPLPNFFDGRAQWPQCLYNNVHDQGQECHSSWAHAIAGMASNRFCIKTSTKLELSPQDLLCQTDDRCNGTFALNDVLNKVGTTGILTRQCWEYAGKPDKCPTTTCEDPNVEFKRYKCGTPKSFKGAKAIKTEILHNGPVVCVFRESIDHMEYYDGIYYQSHNKKRYSFNTAVKLIGWGIEDGIDYWIGELALGRDFGESGYIRYKTKDLICNEVYACTPEP